MRSLISRLGVPAALLAVACVWGAAFVVVDQAIAIYPMYAFLGWRFLVASAAFLALFPRVLKRLDRANLTRGILAGVFLTLGYILQTAGMDGANATTPARAAFITGLYVVITPAFQAIGLKRMPHVSTILGAVLSLVGLYVMSGAGTAGSWVPGDTLVVACALAYSIHIIVLGSTDERHDTAALTFIQLSVMAIACLVISAFHERVGPPTDGRVWLAVVLTGVFASAVAFFVQTWAQRKMAPSRVALILVTETAFGGIFGWTAAGVWPLREVIGAAVMLGGMVTSEAVAAFAPAEGHLEFEAVVEGVPAPVLEDDREPSRPWASIQSESRVDESGHET